MITETSHSVSETIAHITGATHIAVVGVSDKKMGGAIYKELKQKGYTVYPVNPKRSEFRGDRCYASLSTLTADLKKQGISLTTAVLALSSIAAEEVVQDAGTAGLTHLWIQRGADFSEAEELARNRGIETVTGKCILMYAQPVKGVHAVHRFVAKLFGKV